MGYPQLVAFGISLAVKTKFKLLTRISKFDLQPESVLQRVPRRQGGDKGGRTGAAEEPPEKVKFSGCVRTLGPYCALLRGSRQSLLLAKGISVPALTVSGDLCPARS